MASGSEVRAGGAFVEFFTKGDIAVRKKLADMQGQMANFAMASMRYAAVLFAAGVGIAAPLNRAIDIMAASSARLYEANRRTGTSFADLQTIAYATESSVEDVASGIDGVTRTMSEALTDPGGEAARSLTRLGLSVEELQGMTDPERIRAFADGLQRIGNPNQRADMQRQLGLGSMNLEGGGAAVGERQQRARTLGIVDSDEDIRAAREFSRVMVDFKAVIASVWTTIGSAVIPAATKLFATLTDGLKYVRDFLNDNRKLIQVIDTLSAIVMGAGVALFIIAGAAYAASAAFAVLGAVWGVIVGAAAFFVSGPGIAVVLVVGAIALAVWQLGIKWQDFTSYMSAWGPAFESVAGTAVQSLAAINDAFSAGEWMLAVDIAWATIKLVWAQGINWIRDAWYSFKYLFMGTWDSITATVMKAMIDIAAAALTAFMDIGYSIKGVFITIVGTIADQVNRLIDLMPASIRTRMGIERVDFDQESANRNNERDRNNSRQFIESNRVAANRATDTVMANRERGRAGEHGDERNRARDEERRLQGELDFLAAEAETARIVAEMERGNGLTGVPNNVANLREQATVMGSFSADAVRGMEGGPMDRIAENTRLSAERLAEVVNALAAATPLMVS